MKILYGTGNPAKLSGMKSWLKNLGIDIIGLQDLKDQGLIIPEIPEEGNIPLENARQKAKAYYAAFHMPVFSCDSGLYFDNVPDDIQPGVHVRTIGGNYLSDEEMLEHYSRMATRYGNITARYKNAICLVLDDSHIYEAMDDSMESEKFIITDQPHPVKKNGFPLDSLSLDIKTGKYYFDLLDDKLDYVNEKNGFIDFFKMVLGVD